MSNILGSGSWVTGDLKAERSGSHGKSHSWRTEKKSPPGRQAEGPQGRDQLEGLRRGLVRGSEDSHRQANAVVRAQADREGHIAAGLL